METSADEETRVVRAPLERNGAAAATRAATWIAAIIVHLLLGAGVALSFSTPDTPSASQPDALVVILVSPEPEPTQQAAPEAEEEAPHQEQPAPTLDFASRFASRAPPALATTIDELELLSAPSSTREAPPLPTSVQQTLARASECAGVTSAGRDERRSGCPPIPDRLAFAAPSGDAYLDETLLEEGRVVTVLKLAAAFVAGSMVDASIFDGRGGDLATPVTTWEINARMNPLTVDQRIFDPETGDVTILRQAGEP